MAGTRQKNGTPTQTFIFRLSKDNYKFISTVSIDKDLSKSMVINKILDKVRSNVGHIAPLSTKAHVTEAQKAQLYELIRKKQNGLCLSCLREEITERHHLHRLIKRGDYSEANVVLLCRSCHPRCEGLTREEIIVISHFDEVVGLGARLDPCPTKRQ
jgi:hypothetical protein